MDEELKKLREEFIVDQNKYDKGSIPELIKRTMQFAKVGSEGKVFVELSELAPNDKLIVILLSRFLANKLNDQIPETLSNEELSEFADLDRDQIRARMSVIVAEKHAIRKGRGSFSIAPYYAKKILTELENKYFSEPEEPTSEKLKTATQKPKLKKKKVKIKTARSDFKGPSKYINELVQEGFFNKPKKMKEVKEELEKRSCFFDIRYIDKSLRLVFVKNRKILSRLKEGRRWSYVIKK